MSIFSEAITKAITDYRFLLRRHLTQVDRMSKLQALNLRDAAIYENDFSLYQAAQAIVSDIQENMAMSDPGYYSYSGIDQFCQYLKEYLADYEVEGKRVIHRARKASRALLQAIQLTGLGKDRLDKAVAKKLFGCSEIVSVFGSEDQWGLYQEMLGRAQELSPDFYTGIIAHFESLKSAQLEQRSAA